MGNSSSDCVLDAKIIGHVCVWLCSETMQKILEWQTEREDEDGGAKDV